MSDVFFPDFDEIILVHTEIIRETGGSEGLRDAGGLESALTAAGNRFNYETEDLAKLAATFAYRLSQAHAFVDGNKRIAAVVAELFLNLNGAKLNATNDEIIELILPSHRASYRMNRSMKNLRRGWMSGIIMKICLFTIIILFFYGQIFSQEKTQKIVGIYSSCPFHCVIYKLNADFSFEYFSVGDVYDGQIKGTWSFVESNKIIANFPPIYEPVSTENSKTENTNENSTIVTPDPSVTIEYAFPVNVSYTFILNNKSLCEVDEDGKKTFCYKKLDDEETKKFIPPK